jgi:hypothetical protein
VKRRKRLLAGLAAILALAGSAAYASWTSLKPSGTSTPYKGV